MSPVRRPQIAVIGARAAPQAALCFAEELGCALVEAGCRVVTGGLGGVMAAASRGAREAPSWCGGAVIGVLPGSEGTAANPWVDIVVPTGLGVARNVLVVLMADAVVAIGGGSGTLSEIALAWQHDKPVIAVDLGFGWSARLAGEHIDGRRTEPIGRATSVAHVLELLAAALPGRLPGPLDHGLEPE